jgi:endonuclease YncB( thermonuclease family)
MRLARLPSLALALLVTFASQAQAAITVQSLIAIKVVDGDTLHGQTENGKTIKVRMHGMDAPELHLSTSEGTFSQMPWAGQSEQVLLSMIEFGVKGELHSYGQDKFGRTLGQFVFKGLNVNLELVRRGAAVSYAICPAGQCTEAAVQEQRVEEFAQACREAQSQGLGIFDPRKPLEEMPFAFRLRIQKRNPDKWVGDLKTRQYVSPEKFKEIPICDRIFFLSEADAQSLGFQAKI